jgi:hypothetical protein
MVVSLSAVSMAHRIAQNSIVHNINNDGARDLIVCD